MNIQDPETLLLFAEAVQHLRWLKVIGWCWVLTCAVVVLDRLYSMYRLKEAGRYAEAAGFVVGVLGKVFAGPKPDAKPKAKEEKAD